ncbi:MAG: DUF6326 family protein [Candidatus Hodarchaeales archaeon]|jgi:hypothetical protein
MEDVKINITTKLSALWVAAMFCYLYADVLGFFVPGSLEELIAGNAGGIPIDDIFLFASALFMIPPIVMIVLPLILEVRVNRWVNIIVGSVYTLVAIVMVITASSPGYLVYGSVEAVLTALVVWYAWKWPN